MNTPPTPISTYVSAINEARIDDAVACFAPDAKVHDEARDHHGHEAVRAWIEDTTRRYRPVMEILSVMSEHADHRVTARVSGNFPGSPAELGFVFTLANGTITHLNSG